MIKTINKIRAKSTFGSPFTALVNAFNIVSDINPFSKVILIPLANPIIIITFEKSPALL